MVAYMVAKERLAYKKFPPLMKLQELNGAKVGTVHKSDKSCAEIIGQIAGLDDELWETTSSASPRWCCSSHWQNHWTDCEV